MAFASKDLHLVENKMSHMRNLTEVDKQLDTFHIVNTKSSPDLRFTHALPY